MIPTLWRYHLISGYRFMLGPFAIRINYFSDATLLVGSTSTTKPVENCDWRAASIKWSRTLYKTEFKLHDIGVFDYATSVCMLQLNFRLA